MLDSISGFKNLVGTRRGVPTWGSHLLFNTLKMPTFLADSSTDRHRQTQTQTHTDPDMHSISNPCNHTILLLHCWENRQIEEQCFFFLLNSLKAKDQMQFPFFNSGKSFFFSPKCLLLQLQLPLPFNSVFSRLFLPLLFININISGPIFYRLFRVVDIFSLFWLSSNYRELWCFFDICLFFLTKLLLFENSFRRFDFTFCIFVTLF